VDQELECRQGTTATDRKMHHSKTAIILTLTGLVAVVLIAASVVLNLGSRRKLPKVQIQSCMRPDCLRHRQVLISGMNNSVDPCTNVTAYVCSGLRLDQVHYEMSLIRLWNRAGATYLERNNFTLEATQKAAAMYSSCVNQGIVNLTSDVIAFLRARGLHWPNEELGGKDPLDVVLDLLINWGVPFLFHISLRKLPSQTRHSISIGPVYSRQLLDERYDHFPSSAGSFLEYWVATAIQHKKSTSNWPYDGALLRRHGFYYPVVKYAYFWNTVFVHVAALASPLFYANGTLSANYGGIGALFSREVVRILDNNGITLDIFRKNRSWVPDKCKRELEARRACFADQHTQLDDVAALLIAHRAYEFAVRSRGSGTTVAAEGLGDDLASERVFFLTYCRRKCTMLEEPAIGCHAAVRQLEAFSEAFRCHKNAATVPQPKCAVF
ncbi:unnamed protein product, partial [Ixodes hexagonus]